MSGTPDDEPSSMTFYDIITKNKPNDILWQSLALFFGNLIYLLKIDHITTNYTKPELNGCLVTAVLMMSAASQALMTAM